MRRPPVVLTKQKHFAFVASVIPEALCIEHLSELPNTDCLLSYQSAVIVPKDILTFFLDVAINFHGAPPSYPGRDPHHWATYDGAKTYGATAHWMWPQVDSGPIIGEISVGTRSNMTPADYRAFGEASVRALFSILAPEIISLGVCETGSKWSGHKRSRADLIQMCDMRGCEAAEVKRRQNAFQGFESHFQF